MVDNGAYHMRGGFSGEAEPRVCVIDVMLPLKFVCADAHVLATCRCRCMPNYTGTLKRQCRTLVGDEAATDVKGIVRCQPRCISPYHLHFPPLHVGCSVVDQSQLFVARPFDRGYIVNWPCQQQLWDRMLATVSAGHTPRVLNYPRPYCVNVTSTLKLTRKAVACCSPRRPSSPRRSLCVGLPPWCFRVRPVVDQSCCLRARIIHTRCCLRSTASSASCVSRRLSVQHYGTLSCSRTRRSPPPDVAWWWTPASPSHTPFLW